MGVGWHKQWIRLRDVRVCVKFGGPSLFFVSAATPWVVVVVSGSKVGEGPWIGERRRGLGGGGFAPSGILFAWPGGGEGQLFF